MNHIIVNYLTKIYLISLERVATFELRTVHFIKYFFFKEDFILFFIFVIKYVKKL